MARSWMYSQRRVADFGALFAPRAGDQLGDVLKEANRVRPHRRLDRFQDEEIGGGGTGTATDARQREASDRNRGGGASKKVVRLSRRRELAECAAK